MTVNSGSGELKVSRRAITGAAAGSQPSGWTLFVYLCGTDLESDYYAATGDLFEMLAVSGSDKFRFIVQTGGTYTWHNEVVAADKTQRYLIQNG